MATVYAATDTRLDRIVAVKVMRPALAEDPDFVERFTREARAAARLSSPEVVAVHDQGTDAATGTAYLVMEHVAGPHPARRHPRARRRCPRPARCSCSSRCCARWPPRTPPGSSTATSSPRTSCSPTTAGSRSPTSGWPAPSRRSNLTATTGLLIGTVAYLAPEQVEHGRADTRTDVYAAGHPAVGAADRRPAVLLRQPAVGRLPARARGRPRRRAALVDGHPRGARRARRARHPPRPRRPAGRRRRLPRRAARRARRPRPGRRTSRCVRRDEPPDAGRPARADRPAAARRSPRRRAGRSAGRPPRKVLLGLAARRCSLLAALAGGWWLTAAAATPSMPPRARPRPGQRHRRARGRPGFEVERRPRAAVLRGRRRRPGHRPGPRRRAPRCRKGSTVDARPVARPGPPAVPEPGRHGPQAAAEAALDAGRAATSARCTEQFSARRPTGTVVSHRARPPASGCARTPPSRSSSARASSCCRPRRRGQDRRPTPSRRSSDAGFGSGGHRGLQRRPSRRASSSARTPPTGTRPARTPTIALQVSKGPELITVPDLSGEPREEAEARAEGAGLKVARQPRSPAPAPSARRTRGAGAQVRKGSTVTLFVF